MAGAPNPGAPATSGRATALPAVYTRKWIWLPRHLVWQGLGAGALLQDCRRGAGLVVGIGTNLSLRSRYDTGTHRWPRSNVVPPHWRSMWHSASEPLSRIAEGRSRCIAGEESDSGYRTEPPRPPARMGQRRKSQRRKREEYNERISWRTCAGCKRGNSRSAVAIIVPAQRGMARHGVGTRLAEHPAVTQGHTFV